MSELAERALRTLRACEGKDGVVAGRRHFHQYWIRDACFASWGHLVLAEYDRVERLVTLFADQMASDGRLPLRFGSPWMPAPSIADTLSRYTRYVADDPEPVARWGDDKRNTLIVDSNPLFILTAGLLELSRGTRPDMKRFAMLECAFAHSESHCRFGLIWQEPYADWCDSIKRRGYVTYTNALHYGAARVLALLAPNQNKRARYAIRAREIRTLMNERLWIGSRYAEWGDERSAQRTYSVESNMLAVLLGIADTRQTTLVFSSFDRIDEFASYVGRRASPRYRNALVSKRIRLLGMREYHDRMQWLWTSGLVLLSSRLTDPNDKREERIETALENLTRGDEWISEVYLDNRVFRNAAYKSEEPFAWSSGMLLAGLIEDEGFDRAISKIRDEQRG
jgi:hypothetical protein